MLIYYAFRFRVSLAFFSVCGLDILDSLDLLEDLLKNDIIDWLYRLQIKQTINGIECSGFMVMNHIHANPMNKNTN